MGSVDLQIQIGLDADAEASELDEETARLYEELLKLDIDTVERPRAGPPPSGTRAVEAALLGTLLVKLGPGAIAAVAHAIGAWVTRDQARSVKVTLGDDSIELSGVSDENQKRLIEGFVARHANTAG